MKINIEDKVELEGITRNSTYARVALFLDNVNVLFAIKEARERMGLDELVPYKEAYKWLARKTKVSGFVDMDDDKFIFRQITCLELRTGLIAEKFHRGDEYFPVIRFAILAGEVTDKECSPAAMCVPFPIPEDFAKDEPSSTSPMVAILISPETTWSEVKELYSTEAKQLFTELAIDRKRYYTSDNIRRDRQWYWEHTYSGLSYGEIWSKALNENNSISKDGVIQAIKQYRSRLAKLDMTSK